MTLHDTADGHGSVAEYIQSLKNSPTFGPQAVHHEEILANGASYRETKNPLPQEHVQALRSAGIDKLYRHQSSAVDLVRIAKPDFVLGGMDIDIDLVGTDVYEKDRYGKSARGD